MAGKQWNSLFQYNCLVGGVPGRNPGAPSARRPNCGDALRVLSTTSHLETGANTQGNDLEHSKNGKNWVIRSELLRAVYGWPMESVQRLLRILSIWKTSALVINGRRCEGPPYPDDRLRYSLVPLETRGSNGISLYHRTTRHARSSTCYAGLPLTLYRHKRASLTSASCRTIYWVCT